ncbi:hypothetical protein MBOE_04140 [Mycolicibacterium boenickei]|uniref:Uncharacterized protein n=1 Tax=Mycolicibacterium boenickei TaxID=146017 RepID=A0ABN5Z3I4_9MYCO|nr:hypothetical protein MBOE_04140 [Mycolicibacterium boenickei]
MAGDHVIESRIECTEIQSTVDPERDRHVVGRCPVLESVEEPQPLLRVGQRNQARALARRQRRTPVRIFADMWRQLRHRRRIEQGAYRQPGVQTRVHRGDDPHRHDAVTAEIEEGVVDPDPIKAEGLGEDLCQGFFGGSGRCPIPITRVFGSG